MSILLRPSIRCDAKYFYYEYQIFCHGFYRRSRLVLCGPSSITASPSSVSAGRTNEQVTNPQAPGGGHGQVWVNTEAGVYHREGSPFYGTTRKGKYMTEQDATQAGYKPAPKTR